MPTTAILLVSSGRLHPSPLHRFLLRQTLAAMPGLEVQATSSLETLPYWPTNALAALVLYLHHEKLSPAALESLDAFVGEGGGLLAVHAASASFDGEPRYRGILGGRFVWHGPVEAFDVRPAQAQAGRLPRLAESGPFRVRDELYRHECDSANHVHFYTVVGGQREPVVWTRQHGEGRVCYCALGHTLSSMRHPQVGRILRSGLEWVSRDRSRTAAEAGPNTKSGPS